MGTITIGVDLAKQSFSACEMDAGGRVRQHKDFRRDAFAAWLPHLPAGTLVAMEACSGAHHWARRCEAYGLMPRLIAAQLVTPFRKRRTTKNDRNDAEAIATAARQGNMRFVPVKAVDQQARLAWHRVREGCKGARVNFRFKRESTLAPFHSSRNSGQSGLKSENWPTGCLLTKRDCCRSDHHQKVIDFTESRA